MQYRFSSLAGLGQITGLLIFLAFPASATADVYKCEDPATGKISFTDTVCKDKTKGAYVPIGPTNNSSPFATKEEIENRKGNFESEKGKSHHSTKRSKYGATTYSNDK